MAEPTTFTVRRRWSVAATLLAGALITSCADSRDATPDDTIPRITAASTTTTHTASDGVTDDDGRADHGGTRAATDPSDAATDPRPDVAGTDRDAHGAPGPRRAANGTSDEPGADDDRGRHPG